MSRPRVASSSLIVAGFLATFLGVTPAEAALRPVLPAEAIEALAAGSAVEPVQYYVYRRRYVRRYVVRRYVYRPRPVYRYVYRPRPVYRYYYR